MIVEDGTGLPTANSYASYADVLAYFAPIGDEAMLDAGEEDGSVAIVKATRYIERRWSAYFRGDRATDDQGLAWPRSDARDNRGRLFPSDALPVQLVNATAEYAKLALTADLFATASTNLLDLAQQQGGRVTSVRKKVDTLETEIAFSQVGGRSLRRLSTVALASDAALAEYPAADLWLEELIRGTQAGTAGVRFGRVSRA